ncbi:MAG: alpha/beta fold hydrolase [Candidatus Binatia bacterium]
MEEKYTTSDGLRTRYLEEGNGPVVILLHGNSLGSSAEVYEKNIPVLARAGMRAIAYDSPGYGFSDSPKDFSDSYRSQLIVRFMDTLEIPKAYIVAHSAIGRVAAPVVLDNLQRFDGFVALGASPLLPPLAGAGERPEVENIPPTLESTRKRLEADLYNHALITQERLERRLFLSTGKNFEAAQERAKAAQAQKGGQGGGALLWQRLADAPIPKLYLFGREDRAGTSAKRCALLAESHPNLKIHLIDHCCHLVMIDAEEEFNKRVIEFVKH